MSFLPNFGELFWDTLIKDRQSVNSTMITPRLTAVMMAMTALVGAGPVAAFAQAANVQEIGDLTNAAAIETGRNTQVNAAETTQLADNSIDISNEAESEAEAEASAESEAEGGDAEAESGDARSSGSDSHKKDDGKKDGKYSGSDDSGARSGDAEAEGGDAESEAEAEAEAESEATAVQVLDDVTFDNDVAQTSATVQTNSLSDDDTVAVTQSNVPVQTQLAPVAADVDLELILIELGLLDAA